MFTEYLNSIWTLKAHNSRKRFKVRKSTEALSGLRLLLFEFRSTELDYFCIVIR